eukprot:CAMPEP_0172522810 /NCGR_PEP_ID=MMETSP1066-20121228/293327_1 /TAXON_ID=671091 /ORGANISM="Coscinodiscus wailesii, Strain CCMP2513" /LENGTH=229 /DNA_ID=CAMNT_0013305843 /DNA_START=220 /DNA_END=909 /DNA_ORIENTATION=-
MKCWTLQNPRFYAALKVAITYDDEETLSAFMPFIRALNSQLVCQNVPEMVTYRGSKMSWEDNQMFEVGQIYRIPYYVATSLNRDVATCFKKSTWVWEFHIPRGCPNARNVSDISTFQEEQEVLLPPYTCVRVREKTESSIIVDVLDNASIPSDQCTALVGTAVYGMPQVAQPIGLLRAGWGAVFKAVVGTGVSVAALLVISALPIKKHDKFGDSDFQDSEDELLAGSKK